MVNMRLSVPKKDRVMPIEREDESAYLVPETNPPVIVPEPVVVYSIQ